jgi:hypothetical protein
LPGLLVIATNHHFLMTRAEGEKQFVIQHAQGVAQQPALSTGASAGDRIAVIASLVYVLSLTASRLIKI